MSILILRLDSQRDTVSGRTRPTTIHLYSAAGLVFCEQAKVKVTSIW